jgi:hypothetical protein
MSHHPSAGTPLFVRAPAMVLLRAPIYDQNDERAS